MTRPKLILGALSAACVGTLLWCAWLILAADLPRGAMVASWTLWLISAAAVVTLLAYLREFLRHREAVGREASWKPLPGLVLLWVGGVTALASFAFVLPDRAGAADAEGPGSASTSLTARPGVTSGDATGTPAATVSRSTSVRTTPPAPVSTTAPTQAPATGAGSTTSTTATSTKTRGKSTHSSTGKPTPSSTSSTTSPLIGITLPPPPR